MSYESRKLVNDDEPKRSASGASLAWQNIRERSVAGFVNDVAEHLGARYDRGLRQQLYGVVFSNGVAPVRWHGVTYSGPMLLDLHWRARRA